MSLFKVASLYISCDTLPFSYNPFKLTESTIQENINREEIRNNILKIDLSEEPFEGNFMDKVVELPQIAIWKVEKNSCIGWIYVDRIFNSTMYVNSDYSYAQFWFPAENLSWEIKTQYAQQLFQLVVQCRLTNEGYSVLHAACIAIDNISYALSGKSGIGKSTRAGKLVEMLSADWISGDKPAIDSNNGYVYGVPWDGKECIYKNISRPLKAILKVERSQQSSVLVNMSHDEKIQFLSTQLFIPLWDTELVKKSLESLNRILDIVPVYRMVCDRTEESLRIVYNLLDNK